MSDNNIKVFDNQPIRTAWDEEKEEWLFSVVDVVGALTESESPNVYWRKLKQRLKAEGNESVTNCHALRMLSRRSSSVDDRFDTNRSLLQNLTSII